MMKKLRFEKMNQILIVSSSNNRKILEKFCVHEKELYVNFFEYVRSQLHVNIVSDLMDRDILDYLETYRFLCHETFSIRSVITCLRYFYLDMANFLINNPANIKIILNINENENNTRELQNVTSFKNFDEIETFFRKLIDCSDFDRIYQIVDDSKYSFIIDKVLAVDNIKNKFDNYVIATAILYFLENEFSETNIKNFDYETSRNG